MGGTMLRSTRPTRPTRRRGLRLLDLLAALLLVAGGVVVLGDTGAQATPASGFEITDGNVVDDAAPPPDWDTIFGPGGVLADPAGTTAQTFAADPLAFDPLDSPPCLPDKKGDPTVFTSDGGEKNGDAFDSMTWSSGSIPNNKDDLSNIYAVARPDPDTGDLIIYFAVERVDNNGDSHVDFEFTRSPVGLTVTGTDSNGCDEGTFSGSRTVGDLLVAMDFTNGGGVGTPVVYLWDGDSYEEAPGASAGFYQNGGGAIAAGDWGARDTEGAATDEIPRNGFTEGWVDASALGLDSTCFSSFLAHTRSSQSFTATLKDFAFGAFNTCDANITVAEDGVNEVGSPHTVTATVSTNATGAFAPAPDGTTIDFDIVSGPGALSPTSCETTAGTGSCSVTLTSDVAGVTIVSASTTVDVAGVPIYRTTNGNAGSGGSGNLTKRWVDASVTIVPDGVNEVGDEHRFTVQVTALPSGAAPVSFDSITTSVTPAPSSTADTCATPTVNGDTATCTLTINSPTAGVFTAHASATLTMGGVTVQRSTQADAGPGGSGGATKTYVDARISVGPDGVNAVGDDHTVTATVQVDQGGGWIAAPAGTLVTFQVTGGPGSLNPGSCTTGGAGTCSVTLTSDTAGITTVGATADVTVLGVSLHRTTDGLAGNSGPLTKRWVDAAVSISPNGVNPVGDTHEFTVTVVAIPSGATPVVFDSIATDVQPAPDQVSDTCATPTVDGDTATCTLTISSDEAAVFTANASASLTMGGVSVERSTSGNAGPGGSGPATKAYVDARISLAPDGVNEVGDGHTMTATVQMNQGTGWVSAPAGTVVSFAKVSGPGSFSAPTCTTTAGQCSVTLTSATAGTTVVSASAAVTASTDPLIVLNRSTNGNAGPGGSGNLTKRWVDASITITPDGVNAVGDAHTFTVTVTAQPAGTGAPTFGPIAVQVTPTPGEQSDTCATPTVDGNTATCTLTIDSDVAGVFTANASASVTMGGVTVERSTSGNAGPAGSGPATKTYVDARISIGSDGVNEVGDDHTVTGTVEVNAGDGWAPAPDGTDVTFTIVSGPGSLSASGCPTIGGSCSVTLTSDTAGVTEVSASTEVEVLGVALERSTGASQHDQNLVKRWVDASISIAPDGVNPVGADHRFTVTVRAFPSGATPVAFDEITVDVQPSPVAQTDTCDTPVVVAEQDGTWTATCTLTINSDVAGVFTANTSATVTMGGVTVERSTTGVAGPGGSGPAVKTYVDARIAIGPSGVNEVGDDHVFTASVRVDPGTGEVPAPDGTVIAVEKLSGPGVLSATSCVTGGGTGSCTVTLSSDVAGVSVVRASTLIDVDGVVFELGTDGQGDNSGPATKRWVDASVAITPDGVNPVGEEHTFTVVATAYPSGAVPVTFDGLSTVVTPAPGSSSDTCATPTVVEQANGTWTATCTLTITNPVPDVFEANASVTVTMGGVTVARSTAGDAGPGGSGPATKTYVQARIGLTPDGVNEVGDDHVLTAAVEVNDGLGWAPAPDGTEVALAIASGPGALSAPTCVTTGGSCAVTLTSDEVGVTVVNASAAPEILGVTFPVTTNGLAGNSAPITKRWVDASVSIAPNGVNEVGDPHSFTVTVTAWPSGAEPVAFEAITTAVAPEPDDRSDTCASPVVAEQSDGTVTATCTLTVTSDSAGVFRADASASVTIADVALTRSTAGNAGPGGSGPATKTYVDARITLTPDGVNEVGDDHVFTAAVEVDEGSGWQPAPDGTIVSLAVLSGPGVLEAPECETLDGSCEATLGSDATGTTVVGAAVELDVLGVSLVRGTDSEAGPGGSGNATKEWIDAWITIGPSAENLVGDPHTFTIAVTVDPAGAEPVSFADITASVTPTPTSRSDTCATPEVVANDDGTVTATCTLTINSQVAATYTANATATVTVAGTEVLRSTDAAVATAGPGGSGPATKVYVEPAAQVLPAVQTPPQTLPRTGGDAAEPLQVALVLLAGGLVALGAGALARRHALR